MKEFEKMRRKVTACMNAQKNDMKRRNFCKPDNGVLQRLRSCGIWIFHKNESTDIVINGSNSSSHSG